MEKKNLIWSKTLPRKIFHKKSDAAPSHFRIIDWILPWKVLKKSFFQFVKNGPKMNKDHLYHLKQLRKTFFNDF